MKRISIAVSAVLLLAGFVLLTVSCQGHGPMGHNGKRIEKIKEYALFRISSELDLTENQKTMLNNSIDEIHKKMEEVHSNRDGHFTEMKALILSSTITEDQVDRFIQDRINEMAPVKELAIQKLVEFHATLTPEQKAKIIELMEKHKAELENGN
ncbi:MAG: Spy/CpxP family protein refolding chaperone [Spirochaetales bacterium]|nr:Spy/CpxP family protein refolding chaperone [Spirochaetales bacterium]